MPPLNLIALLFLRPLRLVLPSEDARRIRIIVLKATHAPFVGLIWLYEQGTQLLQGISDSPNHRPKPSRHLSGHLTEGPKYGINVMTPSKPIVPRLSQHTAERHGRGHSVSSTNEYSELMALISTLSAKVDDLSTMVAGQQTP